MSSSPRDEHMTTVSPPPSWCSVLSWLTRETLILGADAFFTLADEAVFVLKNIICVCYAALASATAPPLSEQA